MISEELAVTVENFPDMGVDSGKETTNLPSNIMDIFGSDNGGRGWGQIDYAAVFQCQDLEHLGW